MVIVGDVECWWWLSDDSDADDEARFVHRENAGKNDGDEVLDVSIYFRWIIRPTCAFPLHFYAREWSEPNMIVIKDDDAWMIVKAYQLNNLRFFV